jgi:hypothetical protein
MGSCYERVAVNLIAENAGTLTPLARFGKRGFLLDGSDIDPPHQSLATGASIEPGTAYRIRRLRFNRYFRLEATYWLI